MIVCCSRRTFLAGVIVGPILLAGCSGESATAGPPEISYGRDTCDSCGMIVSDERYAGALVATDGTTRIFDDIGEMVETVRAEGLNGQHAWVHDWNSREWIDAASATFVRGEREATPMGSGLVAFAAKEDAEPFASEEESPLLTWAEVTEATES